MIHINAKQTKMQFTKNGPITYRYVLRPVNYSRLAEKKVIAEASVRSGIAKGALKGAWDAINDMLKNTAQLVHSGHRSINIFVMNMVAALAAYCFFENKPQALEGYCIEDTRQLEMF